MPIIKLNVTDLATEFTCCRLRHASIVSETDRNYARKTHFCSFTLSNLFDYL